MRHVGSINDEYLQHRLLSKAELKFKKAVDLAQAFESAAKHTKHLQTPPRGCAAHTASTSRRQCTLARPKVTTIVARTDVLQDAIFDMPTATNVVRGATSQRCDASVSERHQRPTMPHH